jgi:hypothetical protein
VGSVFGPVRFILPVCRLSWFLYTLNIYAHFSSYFSQRTDMKLVTKYQICVINSCWEKYDEKCAYMFNVYKNQLSRQTGSMNLTGPKTLPTIWHTYMKLVTKYQISAIDSCWEKCDEKYLGWTEGRTEGVMQCTVIDQFLWYVISSYWVFLSSFYAPPSTLLYCTDHRPSWL